MPPATGLKSLDFSFSPPHSLSTGQCHQPPAADVPMSPSFHLFRSLLADAISHRLQMCQFLLLSTVSHWPQIGQFLLLSIPFSLSLLMLSATGLKVTPVSVCDCPILVCIYRKNGKFLLAQTARKKFQIFIAYDAGRIRTEYSTKFGAKQSNRLATYL